MKRKVLSSGENPVGTQHERGGKLSVSQERLVPFPELREGKLTEHWHTIHRLSKIDLPNDITLRSKLGLPELVEGTLVYGVEFDLENIRKIATHGVLCSELKGIVEDTDQNDQVEFFKVPKNMSVKEYMQWCGELETISSSKPIERIERAKLPFDVLRNPFGYQGNSIAILLNTQNSEMALLQKKGTSSDQNKNVTAVLGGVPSNFITGIVLPPKVMEQGKVFDQVQAMFGCDVLFYDVKGNKIKPPLERIESILRSVEEVLRTDDVSHIQLREGVITAIKEVRQLLNHLGEAAPAAARDICRYADITNPDAFLKALFFMISDSMIVMPRRRDVERRNYDKQDRDEAKLLLLTTLLKSFSYIISAPTSEERIIRAQESHSSDIFSVTCAIGKNGYQRYVEGKVGDMSFWLQLKHVLPQDLTADQIHFMKRLYASNYGQFDLYRQHLQEKLDREIIGKEGEFFFLQADHPVGFIHVQQIDEKVVEMGALNILQPFQQMRLVDPFIVSVIREVLQNYSFEELTFTVVAGSKAEALYKSHFYAVEISDTQTTLEDQGKTIVRYQMRITRDDLEKIAYWRDETKSA